MANIHRSPYGDIDIPEIAYHTWMFDKFIKNGDNTAMVRTIKHNSILHDFFKHFNENVYVNTLFLMQSNLGKTLALIETKLYHPTI